MDKLHTIIENARSFIVRILIPDADQLRFSGLVKVRELPHDCDQQSFTEWWPRLTEHERERWTVYEHKNVLTNAGRSQLLTYIGSSTATTLGFAQYFSVGTFPISAVSPGDTSVQSELFRSVPVATTITGTQIDVSSYFGPSQAVGTYSNAGLYGVNAMATLGTGTLMTHTLFTYTKSNGTPINADYLINLT